VHPRTVTLRGNPIAKKFLITDATGIPGDATFKQQLRWRFGFQLDFRQQRSAACRVGAFSFRAPEEKAQPIWSRLRQILGSVAGSNPATPTNKPSNSNIHGVFRPHGGRYRARRVDSRGRREW
jgi:hypothetical protein